MLSNTQLSAEYLAEDKSAHLLQTCIVFLVLETLFISLLYTSRFLSDEQQKANWTMIMLMTGAYIVCVSKITVAILMIYLGGAGRHMRALSPSTIVTGLKLNIFMQVACPLATSLSKLSVLLLFYTIFGRTSRRYRIVIRATFVLVVVILLVQFIIPFANCKPFSSNWNIKGDGPLPCAIEPLALWRYLSIPNVVTTIIVVGIPVPSLYRLQVPTATKAGLGVVFTVCIAGIVAAIMRFLAFLEVEDFHDFTFEKIKPLCWTIAESGIYLIAGVMPTLRPLVRKVCGDGVFDRILSRSFRSSRSSGTWGNRRWSRMVLRGQNAPPVDIKEDKMSSDVSSKGTLVVTEDEEKGRV